MILVTVGTNGAPFDRLLAELDNVSPGETIIVQRGMSTVEPEGSTCIDYLPFDEVVSLAAQARVIVTHAGVGSVLLALEQGHRPIVVPRLKRFGEAVDDHQVEFGKRLSDESLAHYVPVAAAVRAAIRVGTTRQEPAAPARNASSLTGELSAHLRAVCRPAPPQAESGRSMGDRKEEERLAPNGT